MFWNDSRKDRCFCRSLSQLLVRHLFHFISRDNFSAVYSDPAGHAGSRHSVISGYHYDTDAGIPAHSDILWDTWSRRIGKADQAAEAKLPSLGFLRNFKKVRILLCRCHRNDSQTFSGHVFADLKRFIYLFTASANGRHLLR